MQGKFPKKYSCTATNTRKDVFMNRDCCEKKKAAYWSSMIFFFFLDLAPFSDHLATAPALVFFYTSFPGRLSFLFTFHPRNMREMPWDTTDDCLQCYGTLWNSNYCSTRWGLYSAVIDYRYSYAICITAYFQRVVQYTDTIDHFRVALRRVLLKRETSNGKKIQSAKKKKVKKKTSHGENWNGVMKYKNSASGIAIDLKARLHWSIKLCVNQILNQINSSLTTYFHGETPSLIVITREKHKFTRNIRNTYL